MLLVAGRVLTLVEGSGWDTRDIRFGEKTAVMGGGRLALALIKHSTPRTGDALMALLPTRQAHQGCCWRGWKEPAAAEGIQGPSKVIFTTAAFKRNKTRSMIK